MCFMDILKAMKNKNISQYRLSVLSGVSHSTICEIINGKTKIEKCTGETLYKLSKALDISIEELICDSIEKSAIERSWEHGLPEYLQNDLDAYKKGLKEKSSLLDCLWCELYGSINCAEINEKSITHDHAQYLRYKYL